MAAPIRNIGILAHIDAGKTTLTEQLLVWSGAIRRPGWVEDGSTVTDWQRAERERGITIGSAAITAHWLGTEVTIVDTPGHVDFTMEVERSLRVLDGAVVVLSGPDGVQAQTETVWHQAARHALPVIGFCNKLDRPGFDDEALCGSIRQRLGIEPIPMQVPLLTEPGRLELLDVLTGEVLEWEDSGAKLPARPPSRRPPTDDERLLRELALERVADTVASYDDGFAEAFLAGVELPAEAFVQPLRAATLARACLPLYYGAARSGIGVDVVARGVVSLFPGPDERPLPEVYDLDTGRLGRLERDARAIPAAFVFKTEPRASGGRLAFVRVFAGALRRDTALVRRPDPTPLAPLELVRLLGGEEEPAETLDVGTIGGIVIAPGAAAIATGDTLSGPDFRATFEPIVPPEPVITVVLEAPDVARDALLRTAVRQLAVDDPSLVAATDPRTGQLLLRGMGELHLEIAVERLREEGHVAVSVGRPRAHLTQVVARRSSAIGVDASQQAPRARVEVEACVSPLDPRLGHRSVVPPDLDPRWRDALTSGLERALGRDGSSELPVVGVVVEITRAEVTGAEPHPAAFMRAAHTATLSALREAGLALAEPWLALSLVLPDEHVGRVVMDLARRRGRVQGAETRGSLQLLSARAPVAELMGYATDLRSLTQGRGLVTMEPAGYEPVADAGKGP